MSVNPEADEEIRELDRTEYGRGIEIVEIDAGFEEPLYEVRAPLMESRRFDRRSLAELYVDVYTVTGFREEKTGKRGVPPQIAMSRQDTTIAYLITCRGHSIEWAARSFDLDESTIRTYLSRVRARAEEEREEWDDE